MKVIKEWILALCVMFLVFSVLFGAFFVYVFVDTDLKNISKRCICPIIFSDEDGPAANSRWRKCFSIGNQENSTNKTLLSTRITESANLLEPELGHILTGAT